MALACDDPFRKYLIGGCVGLIGLEAIVHMAAVTGMVPTKGLPLPLVSYGGTSIVVNLIACALIMRASRHDPLDLAVAVPQPGPAGAPGGRLAP